MVEVPVLYITFCRPEYARQSFDAIKRAQPRKLYFYSNKAREDRPDEVKRNEEVRAFVKEIDWNCDLHTFFREEYVDVFTSLWGALDWFFDNVNEGIIIEEDVVTCPAFYEYMTTLIEKFRDNKNIWIISGNNALPKCSQKNLSYFPTRFADIYGWATWADRWHSLDREMIKWPSFKHSKEYHDYYGDFFQRCLQKQYYDEVYHNKLGYHPWDIVMNYTMALEKAYCLMPFTNLSADIGVAGANHKEGAEIERPLSNIMIDSEHFPFEIGEPQNIVPTSFDRDFYLKNRVYGLIRRKLNKYLHVKI